MTIESVKERIAQLVDQIAREQGLLIYDYKYVPRKTQPQISVRIDSVEKKIGHIECEQYSTALIELLDKAAVVEDYLLEVSSPGLNRELRSIEEFRRFMNAPVTISYDVDGKSYSQEGKIVGIEGEIIVVDTGKNIIKIEFSHIKKAKLAY